MARPKAEEYVDRDASIVEKYLSNVSLHELGREFGLGANRLRDILRREGIERRSERRVKSEFPNIPPDMRRISQRLLSYMSVNKLNRTQMAMKIGLSESKVSKALIGQYDWQYAELLKVLQIIGMKLTLE